MKKNFEIEGISGGGPSALSEGVSRIGGSAVAVKGLIMEALGKVDLGLTIEQLSKYVGVHRQTIAKYVLVLEAEGSLRRRKIGVAVLHYPGSKPAGA
jgi:hypothetical protein